MRRAVLLEFHLVAREPHGLERKKNKKKNDLNILELLILTFRPTKLYFLSMGASLRTKGLYIQKQLENFFICYVEHPNALDLDVENQPSP